MAPSRSGGAGPPGLNAEEQAARATRNRAPEPARAEAERGTDRAQPAGPPRPVAARARALATERPRRPEQEPRYRVRRHRKRQLQRQPDHEAGLERGVPANEPSWASRSKCSWQMKMTGASSAKLRADGR